MSKEHKLTEYTLDFSNELADLIKLVQNLCHDCDDTYKVCDLILRVCKSAPSEIINEMSPVLVQPENVGYITKGVNDEQIEMLSGLLSSSKQLAKYANPSTVSSTLSGSYKKLSRGEKKVISRKLNKLLNISAKYLKENK